MTFEHSKISQLTAPPMRHVANIIFPDTLHTFLVSLRDSGITPDHLARLPWHHLHVLEHPDAMQASVVHKLVTA